MKKIISSLLSAIATAAWAIGAATPAFAVTLRLRPSGDFGSSPALHEVALGSEFQADLIISDLGESLFTSVFSFDSNVLYDSKYLSLNNVSFSRELDLGGEGKSIKQVTEKDLPHSTYYSRFVRISEHSLLSPELIQNNQSSTFVLATLTFNVIGAVGFDSKMTLINNGFSGLNDAAGNYLPLDVRDPDLNFRIVPEPPSPVSIPEGAPNGWVYLALAGGAAGLLGRSRDTPLDRESRYR